MSDLLPILREDLEIVEDFANHSGDHFERGAVVAALSRIKFQIEHAGKPRDKLLGGVIASPDLSISKASIDDMGVELGRRDWGQPAVLCYQDRPGVWAVRLSPTITAAQLWKASGIMLSTANAMPEFSKSINERQQLADKTRLGSVEATAAAMQRREFEIREGSRWRLVGLAAAFVFGSAFGVLSLAVARFLL